MYMSEFMVRGILEWAKREYENGVTFRSDDVGVRFGKGEITEAEALAEIRNEFEGKTVGYNVKFEEELGEVLDLFVDRHARSLRSGLIDADSNSECGCNAEIGEDCIGKLFSEGTITREEAIVNLYYMIPKYWSVGLS